jgi:carboxymethylenebutenolidase
MKRIQPPGYLSTPPSGSGPPVLVLHAWWGLNEFVKEFCERLSKSGFTAYAPDLYQGKVTEHISEAETLSAELFDNLDQTRAVLAEAVSFFTQHTNQDRQNLAVIGFSLGAFFALDLSVTNPELIHSVVLFYGTRPGDYSNAKAAYLGHFAEQDC